MPDLNGPVRYIAIGASGSSGLTDIMDLLAGLPTALPAVVMVVLHRPVDRVSKLQVILSRATRLPVRTAADGDRLEPGAVYIGEPADHLTLIAHGRAELVEGAGNEHRNCTVDLLFQSLATHAGTRAVGVVLSGSLADGARGLAAIRHAGGTTMVLTADRDQPPGMPENAIDYDGRVDVIGSPARIAAAIAELCRADACSRDAGPQPGSSVPSSRWRSSGTRPG
jgi:two-component system, chemotaxis family, protein-glutamate methylesterase/glutaminase